jgi:hypothetical protein
MFATESLANLALRLSDIRFGSFATERGCPRHVRYFPNRYDNIALQQLPRGCAICR